MNKYQVSVVVPTKNRTNSLFRTLEALNKQKHLPGEVIIVDASKKSLDEKLLHEKFEKLKIVYLKSEVSSVCIQRNTGIKAAKFDYIMLCDDDIVVEESYLHTLMTWFETNSSLCCVSGIVLQRNQANEWVFCYPVESFFELLYLFIFQHSIWGPINKIKTNVINYLPYVFIQKFYKFRKNTFTLGGWPLITEFSDEIFKTGVYGIGAAVIKKEFLPDQPYDEVLDSSGIGDHYGLCTSMPGELPVTLVPSAKAFHFKSQINRADQSTVYFRRLLALDYFLKSGKKFSFIHRLFFLWSLIGKWILFVFKSNKKMRFATQKALYYSILGHNPYLKAKKKKIKCINPELMINISL